MEGFDCKAEAAALDYAARGIPVFPCNPHPDKKQGSKKPLTTRGFYDATTDPDQIRRWWAKWPEALIGMPTGERSGVFVLDVDVAEGVDGEASLMALQEREGPLPETPIVITPRGGRHFVFRHPGGKVKCSTSEIGDGLDIRGDGGYVILPPSTMLDGRDYRWRTHAAEVAPPDAPEWLLGMVCEAAPKQDRQEKPGAAQGDFDPFTAYAETQAGEARTEQAEAQAGHNLRYAEKALKDEVEKVRRATPKTRNHTLNRAAFNLGTLVGAGVLDEGKVKAELRAAAADCGLTEDDGKVSVEKTIESGLRAGMAQPRDLSKIRGARRTRNTASPQPGGFSLDEDSVARAFAAERRDVLRYCHSTGKWFCWDGTQGAREETKLAFCWARELCRKLNAAADPDDRNPAMAKASAAAAVERYAQADRAFAVTQEIWDRDNFLLNTPEGTVDLRTGELRPHRQEDYCTKQAFIGPAATADHPLWSRFLAEATRGDVELQRFMQQLAGYALTGDVREHALFFIYGPGGNGKGVFLNTLTNILADYATTAAMDTFTASQFDKHPTDMAMLKGARLVSVSETEEGRPWAEARIKTMTGGDPITARFMRMDFFTYKPQFKLLIVGNHKPVLRNVDDAARRRFNIIPFTYKPPVVDKQLEEKLRAEYPAILRWMIDGCLDWQRNGLVRPKVVTEATEEYFRDQDLFKQWLDECCDVDRRYEDTTAALYASWKVFAEANGEPYGTSKSLSQQLARDARFASKAKVRRARGFTGLRIKPTEAHQPHEAQENAYTAYAEEQAASHTRGAPQF
jgi:P4 family phage/plasmid primase-like protien